MTYDWAARKRILKVVFQTVPVVKVQKMSAGRVNCWFGGGGGKLT